MCRSIIGRFGLQQRRIELQVIYHLHLIQTRMGTFTIIHNYKLFHATIFGIVAAKKDRPKACFFIAFSNYIFDTSVGPLQLISCTLSITELDNQNFKS